MTVKETIENILESNSVRRELTRLGKEEYILNQKVKPMKKRIINNDASKKLVAKWDNDSPFNDDKGDSTGKLMLDPTPQRYGGNGAYAVWYSIKGNAEMYADVETINGEKWAFSETWLNEKGAEKLENNKMPIESDFAEGNRTAGRGYSGNRRKQALKIKKQNQKELEKDSKRLKDINKKIESDDFDWNGEEYKKLSKEEDNIKNKYKGKIKYSNHRQHTKKEARDWEVTKNIMSIRDKLEPYLGKPGLYDKKVVDKAWELSHRYNQIDNMYKEKDVNHAEIAKEIDKYKLDVSEFIKKNPKIDRNLRFGY